MQIHELNTFAGTPGNNNYLAIDNGSDTGKISGTKLLKPVNDRIDNLAPSVTPDSAEVLLNTPGGAGGAGTVTLSKSVTNFDYLEFYFAQINGSDNVNAGYLRVPVSYNNVDVSIPAKDGTGLWVQELKLSWSGTTLTISNIKLWEWDGLANSAASSQSNVWVTDVVRVIGIKTSSNTPAEIVDARIGANGRVYTSLGEAIRSQIGNVTTEIIDLEEYTGVEKSILKAGDPGAIYYSNGTPHTTSAAITDYYTYSDFIPVVKDAVIKYKLRTPLNYCMIAFYSSPSADDYIAANSVEGTGGAVESTYTVPADGYVVITLRNDLNDKYADYTIDGKISQLESDVSTLQTTTTGLQTNVAALSSEVSNIEQTTFSLMGAPVQNGFLSSTGQFTANVNYRTTDYIPVKNGQSIDYYIGHASTLPIICFYTNKSEASAVSAKFVTGSNGYTGGTYSVTADGYVRFCYYYTRTDSYAILTKNIPDNIKILLDPLANVDDEIIELQHEVFSLMGTPVTNGFLRADGTLASNAIYRTTGYIPIKNGQSFKYKIGHATTLPIIAFYTKEDESTAQAAKFVTGFNGYSYGTYTASSDGYIRICYYETRTDSYVVFNEEIPDNVKTYLPPNNGVKDLNILCLGDSIFGNDGEIVDDLIHLTGANVINGAFGGTRVTDRGGADNFQYFDGVNLVAAFASQTWTDQDAAATALSGSYPWVPDRLATLKAVDPTTVDLITMDWGTNDYTGGKTIEDIEAAYTSVINSLQTAYPAIRILIITPIWRYFGAKADNQNGDNYVYNVSTLKEIAAAIDEHAKDMRIDELQMYQKMPLTYNTADLYFDSGDSTHLNATGNMVYAHILNGKIQSMY